MKLELTRLDIHNSKVREAVFALAGCLGVDSEIDIRYLSYGINVKVHEDGLSIREKLPRIYNVEKYVTGDAQDWTYAYTWEDFEAMMGYCSSCSMDAYNPDNHACRKIIEYFFVHPDEALLGDSRYKEEGWTEDRVRIHCRTSIESYNMYTRRQH